MDIPHRSLHPSMHRLLHLYIRIHLSIRPTAYINVHSFDLLAHIRTHMFMMVRICTHMPKNVQARTHMYIHVQAFMDMHIHARTCTYAGKQSWQSIHTCMDADKGAHDYMSTYPHMYKHAKSNHTYTRISTMSMYAQVYICK